MYKLVIYLPGNQVSAIWRISDNTFIPLSPDNTDYQNFKYQINHNEAQLEDADGKLMTPEEAKAYVKELP